MIHKFDSIYRKIISEQHADYQVTKNVKIDPDKNIIDTGNGNWRVADPQQGLTGSNWFQETYGIKVSSDTYVVMDLFFLNFTDDDDKIISDLKDFVNRATTLVDEGALLISGVVSDGDTCEFSMGVTIQQLYKHFGYFNYWIYKTADRQIKNIIEKKQFYNSIDDVLKNNGIEITVKEAVEEVLQQIKKQDYDQKVIQAFESTIEQLRIED